jgi:hypothetical protein
MAIALIISNHKTQLAIFSFLDHLFSLFFVIFIFISRIIFIFKLLRLHFWATCYDISNDCNKLIWMINEINSISRIDYAI